MTDPFRALRVPDAPVAPDPGFARALRARLERALLAETVERMEETMTVTDTPAAATALRLHTITPYLTVADARAAVEFYVEAFGAVRRGDPIVMPDGRIGHAEVAIGDSVLMLADEFPEISLLGPAARGGASQSLRLEVADPDAVVERAVATGAALDRPVADSPHGRGGVVIDPAGHRWMISRGAPAGPRPGEIGYASIWTPDLEAAERFYRAVLGWETTAGSEPRGRQVTGMSTSFGMWGGQTTSALFVCYAVPDADEAARVVRTAGGTAAEPTDEPYGRMAMCTDDQGLPFAVFTPPPEGPAPPAASAAADLAHVVLCVPDARRTMAFYAAVLGWTFAPAYVPDGWNAKSGGAEMRPRTSVLGSQPEPAVVPAFTVPDLTAAMAALRAAGGTSSEPERRPFGLAAECTDDQGLRFQLVER